MNIANKTFCFSEKKYNGHFLKCMISKTVIKFERCKTMHIATVTYMYIINKTKWILHYTSSNHEQSFKKINLTNIYLAIYWTEKCYLNIYQMSDFLLPPSEIKLPLFASEIINFFLFHFNEMFYKRFGAFKQPPRQESSIIARLIYLIEFYVLSTIFQPCNGGYY